MDGLLQTQTHPKNRIVLCIGSQVRLVLTILAEVSCEACLAVAASSLLVAGASVVTGRAGGPALQPPESIRAVWGAPSVFRINRAVIIHVF